MNADSAFEALKFCQAAFSGILAGSALYITLIEHPARMAIEDTESLHTQFLDSFNRAARFMAVGSIFPMGSGIACYILNPSKGLPYLIVAGALFFNAPYSFVFLIPNYVTPVKDKYSVVSKKLPEREIRDTINGWALYHKVRTLVDVGSFIYCIYNVVYG
ncbi:uncharacterized protein LOC116300908 [Actinia tenebrosa]|uniref:Uncharacterized protein LOC116300908 n=1 Tax=Actinia tenebrosa TaxID=6105 RepID=A0A6P8IGD0_ACTTE|nr:uncharacterized protein LOC116300908 [Actinia tenebrosa]